MHEIYSAVKSSLQGYADRGIFQNFSALTPNESNAEFRFHWLTEKPFYIGLNTDKCELELKNVLPSIPFRSFMDKDFRGFLSSRCNKSIPAHRRLDNERFVFQCKNRQGNVSVIIGFNSDDAEDAAKTSINLLLEIFNNFLAEGPYQNYMVEVFNIPEE